MTDAVAPRRAQRRKVWRERLGERVRIANERIELVAEGTLTRVVGLALEAVGCEAAMGGRCVVVGGNGRELETEVVGFSGDRLFLMPVGDVHGISPNSRVIPRPGHSEIAVGDALLGRVIDASGNALDGRGPLRCEARIALSGAPINPMDRHPISEPIDVGVRAINAMMTVGRGQRMGLLAGSGVGKSTLLGMMTRYTDADVIVVGLIGERGREVKEFVENTLGESGRKRAVVVAAPADSPPLSRLRGAWVATAIAEYFRDRGQKVLLLMDSLTRFAQAQREIALAIGEPPATKGYPPSVFARLPALIERAGNDASGRGSITAIYTVLTEGDDYRHDPIADAARAILDGQVVLSRDLAEAAHFPAIDLEGSVSRAMDAIVPRQHLQSAQRLRQLYSAYRQQRDLIAVGAYQKGSDPRVDEAIARWPEISAFLQQSVDQRAGLAASVKELDQVLAVGPGGRK
ncbi:MAG: flagellar protein export ATPase FliI [Gammaproteobacteria bacterium HGW-Gammaproteobacteria-4]|jgi:flagellum-specific ATP synthase|nr:MAG: flagellar protein export ATPase FliI [Gammaproteobacteria bacterium HGW-Gammaproteobacteria-4]